MGGPTLYLSWLAAFMIENTIIGLAIAGLMSYYVFHNVHVYFPLGLLTLLLYALGCWSMAFLFRFVVLCFIKLIRFPCHSLVIETSRLRFRCCISLSC